MGYTVPFSTPPRIAGPGTFAGSDVTVPQYWPQNILFTNGGKTRYVFLVNGFQASGGAADPAETWNPAGGVPPYKCYITVKKSVDGGATWAVVGTPNAREIPPQNAGASLNPPTTLGFLSLSCCLDPAAPNKILVLRPTWDFVTYSSAAAHNLVISVWNMAADNWAADLSTAVQANAPVIDNRNATAEWTLGSCPFFIAKRPSDGHIFAFYKQTEFVDSDQSGNDLVIVASGTNPSGSDLVVTIASPVSTQVRSGSYTFVPANVGLTLYISPSPSGWNPGPYLITGVIGGEAVVSIAPQGVAATQVGLGGGVWSIVGANKVSSASHGPFTSVDVNFGLRITAGVGFLPGNYTIAAVDGLGRAILSQNCGVSGSVGGSWVESRLFTTGYFDRPYVSEFDGANWAAPSLAFGSLGVPQNFMPVGAIVGDSSRLHLFCEQQFENLNYPPSVDAKARNILTRTLTAAGALEAVQTTFETDASNGNDCSYFVGTPRSRPAGGTTEILLPWLYTRVNLSNGHNLNPMALNLNRFISADVPVITTETIASGFNPPNWNADQSAPCWVPVVNLNTGDLYLFTQAPSNTFPNNPTNNDIVLFQDSLVGWDAGTVLFTDPGDTQSLSAITANSMLGSAFAGMVVSWNTDAAVTGDIPWADPFYFEIDFGSGCPKNAQGQ